MVINSSSGEDNFQISKNLTTFLKNWFLDFPGSFIVLECKFNEEYSKITNVFSFKQSSPAGAVDIWYDLTMDA